MLLIFFLTAVFIISSFGWKCFCLCECVFYQACEVRGWPVTPQWDLYHLFLCLLKLVVGSELGSVLSLVSCLSLLLFRMGYDWPLSWIFCRSGESPSPGKKLWSLTAFCLVWPHFPWASQYSHWWFVIPVKFFINCYLSLLQFRGGATYCSAWRLVFS